MHRRCWSIARALLGYQEANAMLSRSRIWRVPATHAQARHAGQARRNLLAADGVANAAAEAMPAHYLKFR
jgi:hypothetical protein